MDKIIGKIKKADKKSVLVIIIFFFFMWGFLASVWDNKINHPYPYGYLASDGFWHETISQHVYNNQSARYNAPYMSYDAHDAVFHNPPVFYHLGALMKYVTGFSMWDINLFLAALAMVFIIVIFFLIAYKYNPDLAILSLPLSILILRFPYVKIFVWGWHLAIFGILFMTAGFYILYNWKEIERPYLVFAFLASAIILSHLDEFLYLSIFVAIFFFYNLVLKKFRLKEFKEFVVTYILILIFTGYWFYLFINSFTYGREITDFIPFRPNIPPFMVQYSDFGYFLYPIMIGLIFAIYLLYKKKQDLFLLPLYLFILSFAHYIGLDRIIRNRFVLPLWLSLLFGLTLYVILKNIFSNLNVLKTKRYLISILGILLFIVSFIVLYEPFPKGSSLTNPYSWEALIWMRTGIPQDKEVLFVYDEGGTSQGGIVWNSERTPIVIAPQDLTVNFFDNLTTQGIYLRDYFIRYNSTFTYIHLNESESKKSLQKFDLTPCDFEYVYIGMSSSNELNFYLNQLINKLIERNFEVYYSNKVIIILKNSGDAICK